METERIKRVGREERDRRQYGRKMQRSEVLEEKRENGITKNR